VLLHGTEAEGGGRRRDQGPKYRSEFRIVGEHDNINSEEAAQAIIESLTDCHMVAQQES
jgi:hypothetical protein